MLDVIFWPAILMEAAAVLGLLWLIPRKNWRLFCETVDNFPENVRRLITWRKRRILRAWGKLRTACLQCHVAGIGK